MKANVKDKGKGNKSFQAIEQGKAQGGDAQRKRSNHQNSHGNQRFDKGACF